MRILVVEDEPIAATVLAKGLREHAYAVDVAADGSAALEQVGVNDYDVVILDVLLPGTNGLEVCTRLRAEGATVPILMLTARSGPDERVEGLDAGADDYLLKPYHFPELLARVRALMRRGPALASSELHVEDLTVDTRAHDRSNAPDEPSSSRPRSTRCSSTSLGARARSSAAPTSPNTSGTTASIRCRT
jgi:DNA-binding response OmpR family regulator